MVLTISPNVSLVSAIFARFELEGIEYCLLRNFEGLPNVLEGDIDILVRPNHLPKVESVLGDMASTSLNIRVLRKNEHLQMFAVSSDEVMLAVEQGRPISGIALDFQTRLQWNGIPYMDAAAVLERRQQELGFFVPEMKHRSSHLACHIVLDKNYVKTEYKNIVLEALSLEGEAAFAPLIPTIGKAGVGELYAAFRTGSDAAILEQRKPIIRKLLFSALGAFPSLITFLMKKYLRMVRHVLAPPGILIATAGPDGAGKSTLIDGTAQAFAEEFLLVKKQYMGWREFILPTKKLLGRLRPGRNKERPGANSHPESESNLAESRPNWTYNLSILHYFLDLWARYVLLIRPALSRGGLVLCDRYFYDVLVRDAWVCRNRWGRWLLFHLTPRPTVTVLFTGDPEIIVSRKQEVSGEEAARQMNIFAALDIPPERVLKLDVTNPLDQNLANLSVAIIKKRNGEDTE